MSNILVYQSIFNQSFKKLGEIVQPLRDSQNALIDSVDEAKESIQGLSKFEGVLGKVTTKLERSRKIKETTKEKSLPKNKALVKHNQTNSKKDLEKGTQKGKDKGIKKGRKQTKDASEHVKAREDIEKTNKSVKKLGKSWLDVNKNLNGGESFFKAAKEAAPRLGEGLKSNKKGATSSSHKAKRKHENPRKTFETSKGLNTRADLQRHSQKNSKQPKRGDGVKKTTTESMSSKLDEIVAKGMDAKGEVHSAFENGSNSAGQALAAASSFSRALQGINADLSEGNGLFSTIRSATPLIGQGLGEAKQSFNLLGSSLSKTKVGIGDAKGAVQKLGQLFKRNDKALESNDATKGKKNKKNREEKKNKNSAPPALGEIWEQANLAKESVLATYESGAEGVGQAKAAAGSLKEAWQQAKNDVADGKGLFTALKNVGPLIGESFAQAQASISTLSGTVQQAKDNFKQFEGIKDDIGSFFSGNEQSDENADEKASKKRKKGKKNTGRREKNSAVLSDGASNANTRAARRNQRKSRTRITKPGALFNKGLSKIQSTGASGKRIAIGGLRKTAAGVSKLGSSLATLARGAIPAVATGLRVLGAAFLTNPIGLAITGIAVAAGLVIKFWGPIKSFFGRLFQPIMPVFKTLWSWVKKIFSFSPIGLLVKNWGAISGFFGKVWGKIKSVFGAGVAWLKKVVLAPINAIKNSIGKVFSWFSGDKGEKNKKGEAKKGVKDDGVADSTAKANDGKDVPGVRASAKVVSLPKKRIKPALALGAAIVASPIAADSELPSARSHDAANRIVSAHTAKSNEVLSNSGNSISPVTKNTEYHIHVQAAPGMDEHRLAEFIREQLEMHEQNNSLDNERSLYD